MASQGLYKGKGHFLDASRTTSADDHSWIISAEQQRSLYPKMGTIRLALLLVLAAVGIDSLQAMQTDLSYADRHYSHPDARLKEPVPRENAQTTRLDADQQYYQPSIQFKAVPGLVKGSGTVGCSYHGGMARHFCWTYGCNSDTPDDWCWLPVYCGDSDSICEDHKDCIQSFPCMGSCD